MTFYSCVILIILIVTSCTSSQTLNSAIRVISIEKRNKDFYSGSLKIDNDNCFPNNLGSICTTDPKLYEKGKPLNIVELNIDARYSANIPNINEALDLAAAQAAIDSGHKYYIEVEEHFLYSCTDSSSFNTTGSLIGNTYFGTTTNSNKKSCVFSKGKTIYAFSDLENIKNGVFNYAKSTDIIIPDRNLYNSLNTRSNLNYKPNKVEKENNSFTSFIVKNEPWKSVYNAENINSEIRKKFNISMDIKFRYKEVERNETTTIKENNKIKLQ